MTILYEFFIAIGLALFHQIVGQEIHTDYDKSPATARLDMDVNMTVSNICQHIPDSYCILSDSVYIRRGNCLTSHDGTDTIAAFGLCPYFPNELS